MASIIGKSLSEIDDMDAVEVQMWRLYLSEPRAEDRSDYHAAQICHAIYTVIQSFSGGKVKMELEDNLLRFTTEEEKEDQSMYKNIAALAAMFGKTGAGISSQIIDKINSSKDNTQQKE